MTDENKKRFAKKVEQYLIHAITWDELLSFYDEQQSLAIQLERERILPYLHRIRANIPLTGGMPARDKMKELIDSLSPTQSQGKLLGDTKPVICIYCHKKFASDSPAKSVCEDCNLDSQSQGGGV